MKQIDFTKDTKLNNYIEPNSTFNSNLAIDPDLIDDSYTIKNGVVFTVTEELVSFLNEIIKFPIEWYTVKFTFDEDYFKIFTENCNRSITYGFKFKKEKFKVRVWNNLSFEFNGEHVDNIFNLIQINHIVSFIKKENHVSFKSTPIKKEHQ
jgi:hypothetical protein